MATADTGAPASELGFTTRAQFRPNRTPREPGERPANFTSPSIDCQGGDQLQLARTNRFHAMLVPWPQRSWDPIEILPQLREYMDGLHPTKAAVTYPELKAKFGIPKSSPTRPRLLNAFLWSLGAWPFHGGNARAWVNPNYIHLTSGDTIYPDLTGEQDKSASDGQFQAYSPELIERRAEWLRWGFSVGLPLRTLTKRWGCCPKSCYEFIDAHGWPLEEWREEGREIRARTIKTCVEWGYSLGEAGRAYGTSRSGASRLVRQHAAEYTPPSVQLVEDISAGRVLSDGCL